jgi:hypothetical protein
MDIPQELVSADSLATFGGISIIVVAITNSLKNALGWNPPWVAWILAMAICVIGAFSKEPKPNAMGIFIALVNGCIVYSSAIGMNLLGTAASGKMGQAGGGAAPGIGRSQRPQRPFFSSWF